MQGFAYRDVDLESARQREQAAALLGDVQELHFDAFGNDGLGDAGVLEVLLGEHREDVDGCSVEELDRIADEESANSERSHFLWTSLLECGWRCLQAVWYIPFMSASAAGHLCMSLWGTTNHST